MPDGQVDFVSLNSTFMQNIGSIIRPKPKCDYDQSLKTVEGFTKIM